MPSYLHLATAICAAVVLLSTAHGQQLYKSVGPDGRVVYSDRQPTQGRLEKTIKYEEQPSSDLAAQSSSYVEQLRRLRASAPKAAVAAEGTILYSAKWCRYCDQAKAFLASRNIPYREVDIDTPQGLAALAGTGAGKGIPLLVRGATRLQGFSRASYESVFQTAR